MIYLFDKHLELIEVLKKPHSGTMTRRLIGVDRIFVEDGINALSVLEESSFAGAFFRNKFYIFKKNKHGSNNNRVYFDGINYAHDELANIKVISDRRLQDASASVAMSAAIEGTGWTLGTIQTTSIQSTNFYYITPLQAIQKIIETWQIEPDFYFEFDGKQITGRKIDIYQKRGRETGERYVYGSDILEIAHEEERTNVVTALYGRGKGEEIYDTDGNPTGGYGRRINFADVVWSKTNGDPVDKPAGQEYVEIPGATLEYGYPTPDGELSPRFDVYTDEGIEDPVELLRATYTVAVERSRPLVTFTSTVAKAGPYELGDTNYIFRPDLDIAYEARIFEDEIDLLNPKRTKFKFGDYIPSGQVKRLKEIQARFDGLNDKIQGVEESTKGQLIKISKDWYDALMEVKEGTFFSGSSYNYSLENGNPYGLPAGFYSFDVPLEGNPTGFLVIQGGKIGRGKVLPNGEWDFNLIGDEDGLTADAIVAGKIKAQFIEIGASSTFLEGYDPSTKADSDEVYTITELDTKFTALDGEISSKVSSTTYTNERPTYGATAPTVKPVGKLWVDISVTPNLLKRWTGSKWEIVNDTSDLVTRVEEAESKVTPQAIVDTISEATYEDGELLFAKTSEVKKTADEWTAKFSQVGGENLFKNSEDLSSWVLYQGATLVSGYPLQEEVPEWSTGEAWRVRTTSLGTSEIKSYITISSDLAKLRSRPFTFSVYAKNNRTDASVRIGTNRFGSEILAPSEMKRIIISGENDNGMYMQLQLSAQTANHYLDVTLYHPKFETGWIATDWNDYLYTGITRIDKDGGHFGREGETIETGIAFDGVRIEDDGKEIASFIASGSVISDLQVVGMITGNVINSIDESLTFNVGGGDGYYANISEVMRAIGNRKYLKYGTKLTINIYGTLNETMIIDGFSGGGEVEINLYGKINGYIRTISNSCLVKVYGKNNTQVVSGNGNTVISSGDSYTLFNGLNVDSKNPSSGIGIMSQNGSNVYVENCDFINTNDALYAMSGGKLQALNNEGNPTRFACMASSGRIWARGTVPDGGNYGFVYNFDELTRTPSAFSPPPTTTTDETLVFNHTDIYTYSVKYGARSTHYGKAAAQNRWDTSMTQMKGKITFGSSVYNFISGRDSGTTPTVKMRLRRQNSTHGASASVAPTPEWSGAPSFGGATRGNWTPWVTIPYTLFASSGYTFSFYDGSTGNSYAIWDSAQIQVTRTITQ